MYYDDLPLWGFLGKMKGVKTDSGKDKYFLFKHIHFNILYNDDRVIEINVQTDPNINVDISEDRKLDVEFLYSVTWKNSDISFEERMAKYSRTSSMPQYLEIHWFSIVYSCVTLLLLTRFLATILMRVLKNDFVKYSLIEESLEDQEDSGWKYIHGDVFRFPKNKSLFSVIIGSGTQLLVLYDYSEYGASTDIETVYQCLQTEYGAGQEDLILYGQSVGGGPTLHLAAHLPRL
ncbi:transmembrane 9 superfamily member 3-like [Musa acuminata AAA Group]|uniref:transmembrane 9 superfamily member 3-like n=1 Tax=Musa acuminata AAA Group TaxID=214697 RepID=UPI0031D19A9C